MALHGLGEAQRQAIRGKLRAASFAPRAMLFREGEPSDTLLVLEQGRVRLYRTSENGEEFTTGVCMSGSILGLAALVLERPRVLSAQALEAVEASVLCRPDFVQVMKAIPAFADNITRVLATLAVESIERSGPLALDRAPVRLGTILASIARPDETDATHQRLEVGGLTQEDLAKMVGASRTWVALTLAEFERRGLIIKRRGRITIRSAERLANFIAAERNHEVFQG